MKEELGIAVALEEVGSFSYRAVCDSSGLVEHELDHVFVGTTNRDPEVDRQEVAEWRWVDPSEVLSGVFGKDAAPWLDRALRLALEARGAGSS